MTTMMVVDEALACCVGCTGDSSYDRQEDGRRVRHVQRRAEHYQERTDAEAGRAARLASQVCRSGALGPPAQEKHRTIDDGTSKEATFSI